MDKEKEDDGIGCFIAVMGIVLLFTILTMLGWLSRRLDAIEKKLDIQPPSYWGRF